MRADTDSPPDWPRVSAVVLSGGQSSRLGQDKSFLTIGGVPLVVRTVQALTPLTDDVILVTNDRNRYARLGLKARLVPDEQLGVGALMGLYSGLKAARHRHALVLACDMPFVSLPLLRYMIPLARGAEVVIPRVGGHLEPLHAVYSKTCLPHMADLLTHDRRKIIAFFDRVSVRYVEEAEIDLLDPDHMSFLNVNTPSDWERVKRHLEDGVPNPGLLSKEPRRPRS